jgi:hypothetical protein
MPSEAVGIAKPHESEPNRQDDECFDEHLKPPPRAAARHMQTVCDDEEIPGRQKPSGLPAGVQET